MSVVLDRLTALLAHRRTGDPENDAMLDAIIGGISDAAERLGLVAFGDPDAGIDASRMLRDPRVAPDWALAHAALYTGGIIPPRLVRWGAPVNLITNPSGETTPTVVSTSASSAGQTAATVVDTTAWSKHGQHASRYTVARTDGSACAARTAIGLSGRPVTPNHFYAARVSTHLQALVGAPALDDWRAALYWYKADGTASAVTAINTGPLTVGATPGAEKDHVLIAQAPSDAAFLAVGGYLNIPTPVSPATVVSMTVDLDAFQAVDLGATWTGPTLTGTVDADVPTYRDGTMRQARWTGAAHASTTESMIVEETEDYLARARDAVVFPLGIKRGTHEALRRTVEPFLTGTKTVIIQDNYIDEYGVLVRTIGSETPDPEAVRIALEGDFVSSGRRGAINAEMKLTYLSDDIVEFEEATLTFDALDVGVTAANVTREDVT